MIMCVSLSAGGGSVCAAGQEWSECVRDVLLCSDLGTDVQRDATCHPGCQCPDGSALQVCVCVWVLIMTVGLESVCVCDFLS